MERNKALSKSANGMDFDREKTESTFVRDSGRD